MSELIRSLSEALRANPNAHPLRVHLAELLIDSGDTQRAISELGTVLGHDPNHAQAQQLLQRAVGVVAADPRRNDSVNTGTVNTGSVSTHPTPADTVNTGTGSIDAASADSTGSLNWAKLEAEIGINIEPPFTTDGSGANAPDSPDVPEPDVMPGGSELAHTTETPYSYEDELERLREQYKDDPNARPEDLLIRVNEHEDPRFFEDPAPERITLSDVGGLEQVKERLRLAFLEPMRNPEIAKAYGKSLRGGLLLYGPPGTGKTFLARAVAGELNAKFLSISIADILDGVMGESEKNVRRIFERARDLAPCVLFIDELDSLGGKRSGYSNMGWMRNVVNQMLQEMDGVGADNDGVFILAATNHPWDVDNALLRPGRFDRIVLVTAPDPTARAAILKHAFSERPIAGIDLDEIVTHTHGFSGADLTHLAATAAEHAMSDSIASGELRPIGMPDIRKALQEVGPSTGPWLQSARNVVDFANADGRYDDLKLYLEAELKHKHKKLKK